MDEVRNRAEIIIGKQRHGPIGTVELQFDSRFTRFSNLAHEHQRALGHDH
jgi:replicative DNA helicase